MGYESRQARPRNPRILGFEAETNRLMAFGSLPICQLQYLTRNGLSISVQTTQLYKTPLNQAFLIPADGRQCSLKFPRNPVDYRIR